MKTKTFGAVAASILIGSSVLLAPAATAAPASTVIAVDQSGVVIAQDQTAQLQAVPSAPRAITVTTEPVSATMKFAPEMPMSAAMYLGRNSCRALSTSVATSPSARGSRCFSRKSASTSSRVLCIAGSAR